MNIIVQAGGRGSRLRHHTWNKPKCLVSIRGKPLLYHLFDKFPNENFIIIGDYAYDKLEQYLNVNPPGVKYKIIKTDRKGTLSGIKQALNHIDPDTDILLTWSDLIINNFSGIKSDKPCIITTSAFTCRWCIQDNGALAEIPGNKNGVAGIFYFKNKKILESIPDEGEFVKWFSKNINSFDNVENNDLEELGDFSNIEIQNEREGFSRFFNRVEIFDNTVKKTCIDDKYKHLIDNELFWYKSVSDLGFRRIPKMFSSDNYTMSRIKGNHAFDILDLRLREQRAVLADYIDALTNLHDLGTKESQESDVVEVYINKTIKRVTEVSSIIPNFEKSSMTINGKKCKNIFSDLHFFDEVIKILMPKVFTPIHGDPTFSNTIIDENLRVWFIDPRGYFAKPGIWGDPIYDYAKVYYSAVGGYDLFNRRKFKLHIDSETVEILMPEPVFSNVAKEIFKDFFEKDFFKIEILHGLIWLSLSGYVKDDIDSVIGSFYNGLYWLEEGMSKI